MESDRQLDATVLKSKQRGQGRCLKDQRVRMSPDTNVRDERRGDVRCLSTDRLPADPGRCSPPRSRATSQSYTQ